jgi:hypothetical protein
MPIQIDVQNFGQVTADTEPNRCPVCLERIQPLTMTAGLFIQNSVEKLFRCPSQDCGRLFIARYRRRGGSDFVLDELFPLTIKRTEHSDVIKAVSPDFAVIFGEAEVADQYGLKLICGPGYRKALKFLIKDYVIRSNADKAEDIKKLNLAKCISDYVHDGRIKQVSARAVWLGNDETHYLRKWEGKDLADLKRLIELTIHWIEMDELTKKTLEDMPEGR